MARPLRIEFLGAWYHVMNRGARHEAIFRTDDQRAYFLHLLAGTTSRFNAEWHAYCLMDNHYHLMVRTPEGNLQRIMRQVNGAYTQYFNRTEGHDGPLFRGRYKAVLVDAEAYWLQLSRYIHRNPLEAGMVAHLADYRWSSYPAYTHHAAKPDWLSTRYILDAIGEKNYAAYVENAPHNESAALYSSMSNSNILGDDDFARKVLSGKRKTVDYPGLNLTRITPSPEQIMAATCQSFNVEPIAVKRAHQRRSSSAREARNVAMYLCQEVGMMTLAQIATKFGLANYSSASASIRSLKRRLSTDINLANSVNQLILDLTPKDGD